MDNADPLALEYLETIGAQPVHIVLRHEALTYWVGRCHEKRVRGAKIVSTHWVEGRVAGKLARNAKCALGRDHLSKEKAEFELQKAAQALGVTLTPDLIAQSRAHAMAKKVSTAMRQLAETGQLSAFNAEYKRRRLETLGTFMSYGAAVGLLRRCLIRRLLNKVPTLSAGLFEEVFDIGKSSKTQKTIDRGLASREESGCNLAKPANNHIQSS